MESQGEVEMAELTLFTFSSMEKKKNTNLKGWHSKIKSSKIRVQR